MKLRIFSIFLLCAPAFGQLDRWSVLPLPIGNVDETPSGAQREVLARWPDGSARLVLELRDAMAGHAAPWFRPTAAQSELIQGGMFLELEDERGDKHELDLRTRIEGMEHSGPRRIVSRHVLPSSSWGGFHWWVTWDEGEERALVEMNWHAGDAAAADIFFRAVRLRLPAGWTFSPAMPDPAFDATAGFVVAPIPSGAPHILPIGWERPFWIEVHRAGVVARGPFDRWRAASFAAGGYLGRDARLPAGISTDCATWIARELAQERDRLRRLLPTFGATSQSPPSALWPCGGVPYGGMTSGIHISDLPGAPGAIAGTSDGLELAWIELLRYRSRMAAWASYGTDGRPDGRVLRKRVALPRSPTGLVCPYAQALARWERHDDQHFERMTRALFVLAWLADSHLARLYLEHDARKPLSTVGGRQAAATADLVAVAWSLLEAPAQGRLYALGAKILGGWTAGLQPCGSPIILTTGKIAVELPLGNGLVSLWPGHRAEELLQVFRAAWALHVSVGLDAGAVLDGCRRAVDYAWRPGHSGLWERVPMRSGVSGSGFTDQAQWPAELLSAMVGMDAIQGYSFTAYYQGRGTPAYAAAAGLPGWETWILRWTRQSTLAGARAWLVQQGAKDVEQTAATLGWLEGL